MVLPRPEPRRALLSILFQAPFLAVLLAILPAKATAQGESPSHRNIARRDRAEIARAVQRRLAELDPAQSRRLLQRFKSGKAQSPLSPSALKTLQKLIKGFRPQQSPSSPAQNPDRPPHRDSSPKPADIRSPGPSTESIEKLLRELGQDSPSSRRSRRPSSQAPGKLNQLLKDFDPELRSLVKSFSDSIGANSSHSGNSLPWLNDPDFPRELLARGSQKSFLDAWAKDITESSTLDRWLRAGLRWRRKREKSLPKNRKKNSASKNNPDSSADQANSDSVAKKSGSRRSPLFGSRRQPLFGWRLPRFPRLFSLRPPALGRGLRLRHLALGSPRAPALDPWLLGSGLLALFLAFALLNLGGRSLRHLASELFGLQAFGPGPWPVDPHNMREATDLEANLGHLRRCLFPEEPALRHEELGQRLGQANSPALQALIADFEASAYAPQIRPLKPEQLQAHGQILSSLRQGAPRG